VSVELRSGSIVRQALAGLRHAGAGKNQADGRRHEPCHLSHAMILLAYEV
jgi:hypothetical protein